MNLEMREKLLTLFEIAFSTAHPQVALPPHLPMPPDNGNIVVLGAGKAAAAMTQAAEAYYDKLGLRSRVSGTVNTRHGFSLPTRFLPLTESGHPVPDAGSERAANDALRIAAETGPNDLILVLLSGGASALWCAPVEGLTLEDKQALSRNLLRSGAPIGAMNCVRKHVSRIKGGRLAAAAGDTPMLTLAISDVPGDDPAGIGSGPTVGDPTTLEDARNILAEYGVEQSPALENALANPQNETPLPDDAIFASKQYQLIATPRASLEAAGKALEQEGYHVAILGDDLEGEARDLGRKHGEMALAAQARGHKVALLSGGEVTVTIKGDGRGGPNQEYALALAMTLQGAHNIYALAGDTDGTDGGKGAADDPAGAIVEPGTITRALVKGLNPATFLANNDSGGFFAALDDLIIRGPTQTNVNDFRVILIDQ